MIKRPSREGTWLVAQPDHAALSGLLAARWGNGEFARPGAFGGDHHHGPAKPSELLRSETVFAIAEHDNGWWEWEAAPELDPGDGLPLDISRMPLETGFDRWRLGVQRFTAARPYAAILIGGHAMRLHAPETAEGFRHPIFHHSRWRPLEGSERVAADRFSEEQRRIQIDLSSRLRKDPRRAAWLDPELLHPHLRLLQICDAISLHLCFGAEETLEIPDTPRRAWDERTTLEIRPLDDQRILCDPYPFEADPLPVSVRARLVEGKPPPPPKFETWWRTLSWRELRWEIRSGR